MDGKDELGAIRGVPNDGLPAFLTAALVPWLMADAALKPIAPLKLFIHPIIVLIGPDTALFILFHALPAGPIMALNPFITPC